MSASGAEAAVALRPVTVTAAPAARIGSAAASVDSSALRENVALSLADVLAFNSSAYVKSYGRATLSTVSFRGTSSTHTAVTWNGMHIASPMLGTTDFSMIPAYLVDNASMVRGSSSLADAGGALGGLVRLSTSARAVADGFSGQYVQGVGSWRTFDEFLRLGYGRGRLRASARVAYSSSRNDFPFINHDKKENIYDENHQIISSYYPRERNRSGSFRDFHALGSVSYDSPGAGRWSADVWYLSSDRQLPVLTTDYSGSMAFDNRQRENTLRAVASWMKFSERHTLDAHLGYARSDIRYDYWREIAPGVFSTITRSRSRVNSFYGSFEWRFFPTDKWFFSVAADARHHSVSSFDYAVIASEPLGYSRSRAEVSAVATAKWRPSSRWGAAATLRQDAYGSKISVPVPALFVDAVIWPAIALTGRASLSRNWRYPTLNDLYTVPGGNPDLRPEKGFTYDAGLTSALLIGSACRLNLSATWFDSRIDDWIMWLPSPKGFYVPRNARRVHSYGIECEGGTEIKLPRDWSIEANLNYSYTASINLTPAQNQADKSYGKQLPYIPLHSGSATVRVGWRRWTLAYRLQAYSERFTMSSNERTLTGRLPAYSVSNISLDRRFSLFKLDWQAKLAVNNLFNADYQTVLSRPMPGINFEIFLSLTW